MKNLQKVVDFYTEAASKQATSEFPFGRTLYLHLAEVRSPLATEVTLTECDTYHAQSHDDPSFLNLFMFLVDNF